MVENVKILCFSLLYITVNEMSLYIITISCCPKEDKHEGNILL